jgi:hypothetical protein
MKMPGFTAETSLYRTNANYRLAWLPSPFGPSVVPALCFPEGCGPCRNGIQRCCESDGRIHVYDCEPNPPPITCGPCVGFRSCSDGTQRSCSC